MPRPPPALDAARGKSARCARSARSARAAAAVRAPNHILTHTPLLYTHSTSLSQKKALKANPTVAVKELKLNANYITRFGQVALSEAVDMVYEMGGQRVTTVHF